MKAGVYVCPGHIHIERDLIGAECVRVYLWLQNPPDRGRLIFMGSVNRDFVFTQIQAGVQTHNSHIDTHADVHAAGVGGAAYIL